MTHNPQNDDWRIPLPGDLGSAQKGCSRGAREEGQLRARRAGDDRVSWKSRGGGNSIKRNSDCIAIALIAFLAYYEALRWAGPYSSVSP